jgi:hypothetical protein
MKKLYKACQLDVWGNSEEGWDVNQSFELFRLYLNNDMKDQEILDRLKKKGIEFSNQVEIDPNYRDSYITIVEVEGKRPVLDLIEV